MIKRSIQLIFVFIVSCSPIYKDTAEIMDIIAKETFFIPDNIYAGKERVTHFDSLLNGANLLQKNIYEYAKGKELLYTGNTEAAIDLFEKLLSRSESTMGVSGLSSFEEASLDDFLAISYFRHGELQNCVHDHSSASCIIPIEPTAIHHQTDGSIGAVKRYTKILEKEPYNIEARWMLNLSYMTLGQYPEGVPEKWLIPDSVFHSEYPLKRFFDIASTSGVAVNDLAGGSILEDFNKDGLLDIVCSSWFPDHPIRYFINNGDGSFTDQTERVGLIRHRGGLNLLQTDYNNDGYPDIFILRGAWLEERGEHPNTLLRNNADGTFSDVTIEAGLLSFHPTQTATWNDFNNDGWLDLFIGNESTDGNLHPCELYVNNQDGTFTDVAKKAGLEISTSENPFFIKGVAAGDFNNDQLTDIYVSILRPTNVNNKLYRNQGVDENGIPIFEEVSTQSGLDEIIPTFPTWFWDYDNDGWLDIFAAGYNHDPHQNITHDITLEYLGEKHTAQTGALFRNMGDGTFKNISDSVNLNKIMFAMGANFGDLDNDGWLDFYLGTGDMGFESLIPNRTFRNEKGQLFQDVTQAGRFGHIQKGHAISFGDLDNDGDQDIYTVMGGGYQGDFFYNALFENPYQEENSWITINLIGVRSNRFGIGSRLEITVDEEGIERKIYRDINSGGSFGASPLRAEIGLGKANSIKEIKIIWAGSRTIQVLKDVACCQLLSVTENSSL